MNYDKYENVTISSDAKEFKFVSNGTKGDLEKLIQFKPYSEGSDIYNLALGTIKENGDVDFKTLSKNGDRDKILATIGTSAFVFSETYPNKKIFLTGDIPSKTRLYQMAICNAQHELRENFKIHGLTFIKEENRYEASEFTKGTNYDAFLFCKKGRRPDSNLKVKIRIGD